jgi:Zn-dependent protease
MKCKKCQTETFLAFTCQYCGDHFCSEHRLPENHECPRIDLARLPRDESKPVIVHRQKQYEYTVTYTPIGKIKGKIRFSKKEIANLIVATSIAVAVGLSFPNFPGLLSKSQTVDYAVLIVFAVMFSTSFLIHEMAHKFVAQKEGCWAEFRLTLVGVVLTLLSVVSTIFKIISPGAVVIGGSADKRRMGRISIAGPATNIALAVIFSGVSIPTPNYERILLFGGAFNSWIALFNLIPYGIFDGLKVFSWDKKIWILAFAASLALTSVSYFLIL